MKNLFKKIAIGLLLVILAQPIFAADYYFSSGSGDDNRSATQAQNPSTPWKSIKKLNAIFTTLKPGDAVYFRRGETFHGTIHINRSGSAGQPIKIGAFGSGSKPIITSMVDASGWRSIGNGRYESTNSLNASEVQIVTINGKKQNLGRFPNSNASNEGYLTIEKTSGSSSLSSSQMSSSPNWSGGEVVIKKNQWVIDTHKISSHSGGTVNYNGTISSYRAQTEYGFFIQNHVQTLDQYGEWYFNPTSKRLAIYLGSQNPSSLSIQASNLPHLFTKTYNANYIKIENLHLIGSNKDAIYFAGGSGIQLSGLDIDHAGENGIVGLSIIDLIIEKCNVKDVYNNGLQLRYGNNGAIIRDNHIENSALMPGRNQNGDGNGIGIFASGESLSITHNSVVNTGFNGIHFNGNNALVKNNFINTYCLIKGDGGGIYTYGGNSPAASNRKVIGNIILNGKGSKGGIPNNTSITFRPLAEGIFMDDNSNGVEISGNTVAYVENSAVKMSNAYNISLKDNLFFNASSLLNLGNSVIGGDMRNISVNNNVFFSKYEDQNAYRIQSHKNDIRQMASFASNVLFRPFGDDYSIYTRYVNSSGNDIEAINNLESWKKEFATDNASVSNKVEIEAYKINTKIGSPLFSNGKFSNNINGLTCNSCKSSWHSSKINGGTLQVENSTTSSIKIDLGSVKKNKQYLLNFKSIANKGGVIRAYLRHTGSPWQTVSTSTSFELGTSTTSNEVLISPYADIENVSLMIATQVGGLTYWIDDLEFVEVDVSLVDPSEKILFEYNATKSPKTISLNGTYLDSRKKEYTGSVTIPSYGAIALLKISDDNEPGIEENEQNPSIQLSVVENTDNLNKGDNLTLTGNVVPNGSKISKVEFYCGVNLIGSSSTEPYQSVWENIPSGNQYLWASVIDENGKEARSSEIELSIGTSITTSKNELFFNTTSNQDIRYMNVDFAPLGDQYLKTSGSNISTNRGASTETLFQSKRFSSTLRFEVPVPNGTYSVQTYHNETYFGRDGRTARAGQRVFDISLEGSVVKKNLDMFVETGNKETILTFQNVVVTDGVLNIDLQASANNACISGFAILSGNTGNVELNGTDQTSYSSEKFYNTTSPQGIKYNSNNFVPTDLEFLKSSNSNFSTNLGASKEPLFQSGRFSTALSYEVPLANGTYTVQTFHNETYFGRNGRTARTGQRVFDITLEGNVVKKNLDMFAENGNKETILTFKNVVVTDGVLNLDLKASANNAIISGFAILSEDNEGSGTLVGLDKNALHINLTENNEIMYKNQMFSQLDQNYLTSSGSNVSTNSGVSSERLFQSVRWDNEIKFAIPVPNGVYSVKTYHHENYFGRDGRTARAGQRVFNISLEGTVVKKNLDLFVESGNKETELTFQNIEVTDGILNLDLVALANNASISAISIISQSLIGNENLRGYREMEAAEETKEVRETELSDIKLYPNPANESTKLVVGRGLKVERVLIHNMSGQLVDHFNTSSFTMEGGSMDISTNTLQQGMYLVSLVGEKDTLKRLRLVVNH